jgi:hypothetical protein
MYYNNEPINISNEMMSKTLMVQPDVKFGIFVSSIRNMLTSSGVAITILALNKYMSNDKYKSLIVKIVSLLIFAFSFFTAIYSIKDLNLYMNTIKKKYNNKLPEYYIQNFNNWNIWIYIVYLYIIILTLCFCLLLLIDFKI